MTNTTATQADLDARYVGLKERLNAANPDDNHAIRLTTFQVVNALRAGNLRLAERQLNELETELDELDGTTPSPAPAPAGGNPTPPAPAPVPAPTATQPPAPAPSPTSGTTLDDLRDLLTMPDGRAVKAVVIEQGNTLQGVTHEVGELSRRVNDLETAQAGLTTRMGNAESVIVRGLKSTEVRYGFVGILMILATIATFWAVSHFWHLPPQLAIGFGLAALVGMFFLGSAFLRKKVATRPAENNQA